MHACRIKFCLRVQQGACLQGCCTSVLGSRLGHERMTGLSVCTAMLSACQAHQCMKQMRAAQRALQSPVAGNLTHALSQGRQTANCRGAMRCRSSIQDSEVHDDLCLGLGTLAVIERDPR